MAVFAVSVLCAALLGMIWELGSPTGYAGISIGGAGLLGSVMALVNIPLLLRTRLLMSMPFVFGGSLAVFLFVQWIDSFNVLRAIVSALGVQTILAILSMWIFKSPDTRPHYICRNCDYDLRGITSDRCPECGAPRPV